MAGAPPDALSDVLDSQVAVVTGGASGIGRATAELLGAAGVIASLLYLADLTEENAGSHPISGFFHAHMKLGKGREKTRTWVRRVMAYDPVKGRR